MSVLACHISSIYTRMHSGSASFPNTPMPYSLAHRVILGNDSLSLQALLPYTRAELIQTSQQSLPASIVFHHHPGHVQRPCVRPGVHITIVSLHQCPVQYPWVGVGVQQPIHCRTGGRGSRAGGCLVLDMTGGICAESRDEAMGSISQSVPCLQLHSMFNALADVHVQYNQL